MQDNPNLAAQPLLYGLEAQCEPGTSMLGFKKSQCLLHTLSMTLPSSLYLCFCFLKGTNLVFISLRICFVVCFYKLTLD